MRYVFITGMGRSGTKFLGHLLTRAPGGEAHHEHIGDREFWLLSWYLRMEDYSVPYLHRCRDEIEARTGGRLGHFIDVNSYLQHAAPALRAVFDDATIVHLVRDPRKVIPSIYARRNERDTHIVPKTKSEIEQWLGADKFEQVCWNWANATERLLEQGSVLIQFEKVIGDYDYLDEKLLGPCDLSIGRAEWEAARGVRVNRTRSRLYRFLYAKARGKAFENDPLPPYEQWSGHQRQTFERICGEPMQAIGYEL